VCTAFHLAIVIEYTNLSAASEFCARSGVTDCILFGRGTCPVRLNARPLVTLPAASERANLDDRLRLLPGLADSGIMPPMKYWEIVDDKLSDAGWSWGYCSAVTRDGWRWIVDAHRESRRYIAHSDELLSAF